MRHAAYGRFFPFSTVEFRRMAKRAYEKTGKGNKNQLTARKVLRYNKIAMGIQKMLKSIKIFPTQPSNFLQGK